MSREGKRETRTETVGIAVTPSELALAKLYVTIRKPEGGLSGALRDRSFSEILAEGQRLSDAVDLIASAPEGSAQYARFVNGQPVVGMEIKKNGRA